MKQLEKKKNCLVNNVKPQISPEARNPPTFCQCNCQKWCCRTIRLIPDGFSSLIFESFALCRDKFSREILPAKNNFSFCKLLHWDTWLFIILRAVEYQPRPNHNHYCHMIIVLKSKTKICHLMYTEKSGLHRFTVMKALILPLEPKYQDVKDQAYRLWF